MKDDIYDVYEEFRKKYPISYWIDHSLFHDKGLINYSPHYVLSHPWKILEYWWDHLRWAWQRVFRGWDDRIVWSVDYYLANMIPKWLKVSKEVKCGIPAQCFDKDDWDDEKCEYINGAEEKALDKWNNILDKMIEGFACYYEIENKGIYSDNPRYQELIDKFDEGFELFHEHFGSLWD